jgi:hypothetical protein
MPIIDGPAIVTRPERPYLGIRTVTPFRGMLAVRDRLMAELYDRLGAGATGNTFLRLHVIDMAGPMDIEVGVLTGAAGDGGDRVHAGVLPGGRYATLTYICMPAGRTARCWSGRGTPACGWTAGTSPPATGSPAGRRSTSPTHGPSRGRRHGRSA